MISFSWNHPDVFVPPNCCKVRAEATPEGWQAERQKLERKAGWGNGPISSNFWGQKKLQIPRCNWPKSATELGGSERFWTFFTHFWTIQSWLLDWMYLDPFPGFTAGRAAEILQDPPGAVAGSYEKPTCTAGRSADDGVRSHSMTRDKHLGIFGGSPVGSQSFVQRTTAFATRQQMREHQLRLDGERQMRRSSGMGQNSILSLTILGPGLAGKPH